MLEQLLHFAINHWMLFSALIIVSILLLLEESKGKTGGNRLTAQDATTLINHERATVVDLRDSAAFLEGHVINALNLPLADILTNLAKLKKYQNKPLILMDAAGRQADGVRQKLGKHGFTKVYCLIGGIPTWLKAGLPLVKNNPKNKT